MGKEVGLGAVLLFSILFSGCIEPGDFTGNGANFSIDFHMNTTGSVHGTITGRDDAALENATITLVGNSTYSAHTDADGGYSINNVPEGAYILTASKPGYINITIFRYAVLGGRSRNWNASLSSATGGLYGTITNLLEIPLENASVTLMNESSSYSAYTDSEGRYNLTKVPAGTYTIVARKPFYRNATIANFTLREGYTYPWNATIPKDCIYYGVNASGNYALRYGYSGTIYNGRMDFNVSYPSGATYDVYPAPRSGFSEIGTGYTAGNRVLEWMLDNSNGRYSYVEGHVYVNMNGTNGIRLYSPKEMGIKEAALGAPGYLGSETTLNGKRLIDPANQEIMAIAREAMNGSGDTWTVAKSLFIWLKSNTEYYIDPVASNYSRTPVEVLHSKNGKCDELAHLYISLLRADGIPARFVKGYLVEKNPDRYLAHVWVEFYDGEWVPVEVAGSGNASNEANFNFGVLEADHIPVFTDDGTDDSIGEGDVSSGYYYDMPSTFDFDIYYDFVGYNQTYISSCADGTRELKDKME